MGHYSDFYAAEAEEQLLRQHGSKDLPELTERNLAYNIARANKAEYELKQAKDAFQTLKQILGR